MAFPLKKVIPRIIRAFLFALGCFLLPPFAAEAQSRNAANWTLLWGTDAGLYRKNRSGSVEILWSGGKVREIIPIGAGTGGSAGAANQAAANQAAGPSGWAILTDQGVLISENLRDWEPRRQGLPENVIKVYENGEKSFIRAAQEIKAFSIDPENPEIMACALKDAVYLSRNGGRNWESLGMPNYRSNGIKAVAVTARPEGDLAVLCSHGIYGVYRINPDQSGAQWTEMNEGLEKLETTGNPDEVSDFAADDGAMYASQSFRRRVYRLDWERGSWIPLWSDNSEFGGADSLSPGKSALRFAIDGGIMELGPLSGAGAFQQARPREDLARAIAAIPGNKRPNCAVLRDRPNDAGSETISLSELWLLDEGAPTESGRTTPSDRTTAGPPTAANREGLYLPVNHAMDPASLQPYLDIIEERNLNMIVIDMKDDYGRLRFTPENPSLTNLGRVFWPVDIDELLKTLKSRGIYTVARIVVFKDPEAARKAGGKYSVWDGPNDKPWEGYYDTRRKKPEPGREPETNPALVTKILPDDDPEYEIARTWYDEKWVDPYSEEIWDYIASVSEELHRRGFDEIQYDYIRFPTDGKNLGDARYRWRENGMDMDSAILSFLRHARSRVKAPISVDIYGANGWYRTGARTGQEVELLAPWVDVICPMYYPSHFEQDFLAQNPPERRPYRIYFQGTRRTRFIARGRVIVRPWAQAFYLNVSYDRAHYNADYVRREAEGVRAAGLGGLTYWNNSGRYDDIPLPAEPREPSAEQRELPGR